MVQNSKSSILLMLTSVFMISCVDVTCKYMTVEIHALQLTWGYFLGIFICLSFYYLLNGESIPNLLYTKNLFIQLSRSGFLFASIGALFVGLTYIPFAEATAISFVTPAFITIFSIYSMYCKS